MDFKQIRRRCEARVAALDIPAPFDTRAFCEAVAHQRGRPIRLMPATFPRGQYGLIFRQPDAEIICYEQQTSPLHQEHIILHELCHLICGHQLPDVTEREQRPEMFSLLSDAAMKHMLQRNGYSTEEEREVELLASLILERAALAQEERPDAGGSTVVRLGAVLEEGPEAKP